jgi:hypothetical protein
MSTIEIPAALLVGHRSGDGGEPGERVKTL